MWRSCELYVAGRHWRVGDSLAGYGIISVVGVGGGSACLSATQDEDSQASDRGVAVLVRVRFPRSLLHRLSVSVVGGDSACLSVTQGGNCQASELAAAIRTLVLLF